MNELAVGLFSLSLKASWAALAVVLLRFMLKGAPKWTHCLLWSVVGLRLVLPFSVESIMSLVPNRETVEAVVLSGPLHVLVKPEIVQSEKISYVLTILCAIWAMGAVGFLLYALITYFKMYRRVQVSEEIEKGVYLCDDIDKPFILGIIKPRICLPSGMPEEQMTYVIRHERAHLARGDHWWKPLSFVLVSIHWFNPILWLSYKLFGQDIELACDEKTVKDMSTAERRAYSEALLLCGMERRMRLMCPVAFGEVSVQERVVSVMSYRKQALWRVAAAGAMCVVLAVCFLTDPVTAKVVEEVVEETASNQEDEAIRIIPSPYIGKGYNGDLALKYDPETQLYMAAYEFELENDINILANGISIAELKCCPEVKNADMEIVYTMAQTGGENAICEYAEGIHTHRSGSIYAVIRCKNCGSDLGAYYVGKGYRCEYAERFMAKKN